MAAIVLGSSIYWLLCYSVVAGMAGGIDTLAGQAFGAGRFKELGVLLQRGLLIQVFFCAPLVAFCLAAPAILAGMPLGQGAGEYLRVCGLAVVAQAIVSILSSWLNCQCLVVPGMVAAGVTALLSPLLHWLFLGPLRLGITGAALAYSLSMAANALLLLGWTAWSERSRLGTPQQRWPGLTRAAFKEWPYFLRCAFFCFCLLGLVRLCCNAANTNPSPPSPKKGSLCRPC